MNTYKPIRWLCGQAIIAATIYWSTQNSICMIVFAGTTWVLAICSLVVYFGDRPKAREIAAEGRKVPVSVSMAVDTLFVMWMVSEDMIFTAIAFLIASLTENLIYRTAYDEPD